MKFVSGREAPAVQVSAAEYKRAWPVDKSTWSGAEGPWLEQPRIGTPVAHRTRLRAGTFGKACDRTKGVAKSSSQYIARLTRRKEEGISSDQMKP
jgi:hypothetical protein